ncbi:MAG: energy-coupled thiamine transporter ThiT [Oscillospiraceae bacterium]|nr:energy-coupled thiamine transporter ThiT [Oscillospiraceae bacterium]
MSEKKTLMLAEGGVCIALSLALSYLKIPIGLTFGAFGGSIDLVMIPLIVFAVRWGMGWGVLAGLAFGTLKYFVANGWAVSWVSIIFDYSLAYAAVGLAGLLRRRWKQLPLAALIGCAGRFIIHYISGVTVYAQYMPEEFMGVTKLTPPLYSLLYNGTYMVPNTILAIVLCALLAVPLQKYFSKKS